MLFDALMIVSLKFNRSCLSHSSSPSSQSMPSNEQSKAAAEVMAATARTLGPCFLMTWTDAKSDATKSVL